MDESLFAITPPTNMCEVDKNTFKDLGSEPERKQSDIYPDVPDMKSGTEGIDNRNKINDEAPFTDDDWVSNTFMVSSKHLIAEDVGNRFSSAADYLFTDTTLGGSITLNVAPQFTIFADARAGGPSTGKKPVTVMDMTGGTGTGRCYATVLAENSLDLHFEFGYIAFNNVLYYLMSAVDYRTAVIANTGRSPLAYNAGNIFGVGALLIAFPLITLGAIVAKTIFKTAMNVFASPGRFSHNYLKPAMHDFWSTANSIATLFAAEIGFVSSTIKDNSGNRDGRRIGAPLQLDTDELDAIKKIAPGLITTNNGINMLAIVARSQILGNKYKKQRLALLNEYENTDFSDENPFYRIVQPIMNDTEKQGSDLWEKLKPMFKDNIDVMSQRLPKDMQEFNLKLPKSISDFKDKLTALGTVAKDEINELGQSASDAVSDLFSSDSEGTYTRGTRPEDDASYLDKAMEIASAVYNEGARYMSLRVEHTGSYTTTFSNGTTSVGTGEYVNNAGSSLREAKFNLGGMQVPLVSDIVNSVKDMAIGALDGVTLGMAGAIGSFLAGVNINPEKRWDNSTVSLPTHTYKIPLRSPSAHPLVQLRSLYLPLSGILAAVLPKSTGPQSHTSPFHCSMFGRGQVRIDRGMITNVSITAGAGNLGFNKQGRSLGFDVTITVMDFSEMITSPTSTDILNTGSVMYDDEAGLNKMIQAFTARDLNTSSHAMTRAKIKFSKWMQSKDLLLEPSYLGSMVGNFLVDIPILNAINGTKAIDYTEIYK